MFVTVAGLRPLMSGSLIATESTKKKMPPQRKVFSFLWAEMFAREKPDQTSQTICVLSGLQKFHMVAQILLLYLGVHQRDAVSCNISYMSCYAQHSGQCRWPAQGTVVMHSHCQKPTSPYKTRIGGAALTTATAHRQNLLSRPGTCCSDSPQMLCMPIHLGHAPCPAPWLSCCCLVLLHSTVSLALALNLPFPGSAVVGVIVQPMHEDGPLVGQLCDREENYHEVAQTDGSLWEGDGCPASLGTGLHLSKLLLVRNN